MLSDKQKRTIYDQFGEEGLKGGGGPPPGAGGPGGFSSFGGFPGGTSFSFTSGRKLTLGSLLIGYFTMRAAFQIT